MRASSALLIRIVLPAFIFIQVWYSVEASGKLYLRFLEYRNPTKEDREGLCCDGWIGICGRCDHMFLICVDKPDGTNRMDICHFWRVQTTEFPDTNVNKFGNNMHGFQNPVQIPFNSWPGGFKIKIRVEDDDRGHSNHDAVDDFYDTITIAPHKSLSGLSDDDAVVRVIWGRRGPKHPPPTGMEMSILVWCDDHYYGRKCDKFCVPLNTTAGHYSCDPDTGNKVCLPGWEDEAKNCTVFADDCVGHLCMNQAQCMDGPGNYTCECPEGYKGDYCEQVEQHCQPSPCKNGGVCTNYPTGYDCNCTAGYTGKNCTCLAGQVCETCMDESLGCQNGAACQDGSCICPQGFFGEKCQYDVCKLFIFCENSGSCLGGVCQCPAGYKGRYCHMDINECLSNPCQNLGNCIDLVDGYKCKCLPNYSGDLCENQLENSVTLKITDTDPSSNHIREDDGDPRAEKPFEGMSSSLIMGLVIALILLLIIIIVILLSLFMRQRRKKKQLQNQQNQARENGNMDNFDNPLFATGVNGTATQVAEDPYADIGPGAVAGRGTQGNGVVLSATKLKSKQEGTYAPVVKPPPYTEHDVGVLGDENQYDVPPSRGHGYNNPAYDEAPPLPTKTKPKFVNEDF